MDVDFGVSLLVWVGGWLGGCVGGEEIYEINAIFNSVVVEVEVWVELGKTFLIVPTRLWCKL